VIVTHHACQRYVERVAPQLSLAEAAEQIKSHERAVECAADFRCTTVKLGNGARLILAGAVVVTVLPRPKRPHTREMRI
jgi:hypothetical protein